MKDRKPLGIAADGRPARPELDDRATQLAWLRQLEVQALWSTRRLRQAWAGAPCFELRKEGNGR